MFTTSPEISGEIVALGHALASLPIGGLLTYTKMGYPSYYVVRRAIRKAEIDSGSLFATVRGEGVRRLDTTGSINHGSATLRRIRKAAQRGVARLGNIRANAEPQEQRRLLALQAQLGAIALVSNPLMTTKVEVHQTNTGPLPVGRVLEMFK